MFPCMGRAIGLGDVRRQCRKVPQSHFILIAPIQVFAPVIKRLEGRNEDGVGLQ